MKATFLILLFYLFGTTLYSQSQPKSEVQKLNNDLLYLKEVLYTSHPATFKYISKDSLNNLFETIKFQKGETATLLDLEKKTRFILSQIGCIHTSMKGSSFKNSETRIPFLLYVKGNDLWVKQNLLDSLPSSNNYRLLTINDNSASSIISNMKNYRPSDGYNKSFKYALMNQENWFDKAYQFYFDSDTIRTYTLVSDRFDTLTLRRKSISSSPAKKTNEITNRKNYGPYISVKLDSTNDLAILKIKSFSASPIIGTQLNEHRYKKALQYIEQKGFENLVIDLRNNAGGDATSGNSLISFFIQENHSVTVNRNKGKIFKYAAPSFKVGSIANYLFGNLFASRIPTSTYRESKVKVKNSNGFTFTGNTFVITNGFTVSTASNTASLFKHKTNALIIGTETGGSENNLNAYFFPIVKLPYSKFKIQIPQYKINLNLTENEGSGVIPDSPITYTVQDINTNRDLEIEKIIDLISLKLKP